MIAKTSKTIKYTHSGLIANKMIVKQSRIIRYLHFESKNK
jgi:hypothetical protein